MAGSDNKNNFGLFAAVFAAIFGTTYGLFSLGKKIQGGGAAMQQVIDGAEKLFQKGLTEDEIINAFCADAAKQTGRSITDNELQNKVKEIVAEAKKRFEAGGGMTANDTSPLSSGNIDSFIQTILLGIRDALKKSEAVLKLDGLYAKAKEAEEKNDLGDLQVYIQNQEYDSTNIWKAWAAAEQKLNQLTYSFDSSEPVSIQRQREEMAKLNPLPIAFKNLLATRGRVLRHVRNMYNGKNKREETKQHEAEELKVLVKLFQNDINRATAEMDVFEKTIEKLKIA
jgi:hypothetical protein